MLQCRRIYSGEVQDSKAWECSGGSVSVTRGRHCSDSREKVVRQKEKELSVTCASLRLATHRLHLPACICQSRKRDDVSVSAVCQLLLLIGSAPKSGLIAKVSVRPFAISLAGCLSLL